MSRKKRFEWNVCFQDYETWLWPFASTNLVQRGRNKAIISWESLHEHRRHCWSRHTEECRQFPRIFQHRNNVIAHSVQNASVWRSKHIKVTPHATPLSDDEKLCWRVAVLTSLIRFSVYRIWFFKWAFKVLFISREGAVHRCTRFLFWRRRWVTVAKFSIKLSLW